MYMYIYIYIERERERERDRERERERSCGLCGGSSRCFAAAAGFQEIDIC